MDPVYTGRAMGSFAQDTAEERAAMDGLINGFHANHNIKQVFAGAAGYCASHL